MQFKVLRKNTSGNVLLSLESGEPAAFDKKTLRNARGRACIIFDTIGNERKPFYLARPLVELKEGDILADK